MQKSDGTLLLVVDDWEALERYEDRLSSMFLCTEAWPLGREGLKRALEIDCQMILIDLTLEDMTPLEAERWLRANPPRGSPWILYVGERSELEQIIQGDQIRKVLRPFDWETLKSAVLESCK